MRYGMVSYIYIVTRIYVIYVACILLFLFYVDNDVHVIIFDIWIV